MGRQDTGLVSTGKTEFAKRVPGGG